MAIIKSWINDVVVRLANSGITGKTRTLTFEPRISDTGKSMASRPCKKCGYTHAVVFQSFEDKNMWLTACTRCREFSYFDASDTPTAVDGNSKCMGKKKDGSPCGITVKGGGYCKFHEDQKPSSPATSAHQQETRI